MSRRKRVLAVAVSMALAGVSQQALANVDNTWTGTLNQDYNNAGNWSLGHLPTNTTNPQEDALINTATGNFPLITADFTVPPTDLFVGRGPGAAGMVNQTAGTAANANGNWMFIGADGSTGTWNLANAATTGGTYTHMGQGSGSINSTGRLYVGGRQTGNPGGLGTLNINTTGSVTTGNDFAIGASAGTGTVNLDAGSLNVGGWLMVGSDHGDPGNQNNNKGTLNMSGGTISMPGSTPIVVGLTGSLGTFNMTGGAINTGGEMWIGQGQANGNRGNAVMNITAGTINSTNWIAIGREGGQGTLNLGGTAVINKTGDSDITIGTGDGGNGTLFVFGGTVSTGRDLLIGENNANDTGVVNQTAGTVRVVRNVVVQQTGTGSYSLSGGKLIVDGAFNNTNGGSFNFSGGTITRDDNTAPLQILGSLSPAAKAATLGLDGGKTFTLTGTLNVDPGLTLDLTGRAVPTVAGTGSIPLGTVGAILGTFDTANNPIVGLSNPGNATYIDETAGEGHLFSANQSVFWLQESGGQVSLNYSIASGVPEPTAIGVFVLAGAAMMARRRRR